jgi:hypothetical protein
MRDFTLCKPGHQIAGLLKMINSPTVRESMSLSFHKRQQGESSRLCKPSTGPATGHLKSPQSQSEMVPAQARMARRFGKCLSVLRWLIATLLCQPHHRRGGPPHSRGIREMFGHFLRLFYCPALRVTDEREGLRKNGQLWRAHPILPPAVRYESPAWARIIGLFHRSAGKT